MKRINQLTCFLLMTIMCCLTSPSWSMTTEQPNQPLLVAGSGVNLEITRILAKEFMKTHKGIKIQIPGSIGSKGAIKAITDGAITIGLTSRPLKEKEKRQGAVLVPYAQTPIVMGAHTLVPDTTISSQELIDIYNGKKTRWKNGHEIIVHIREPSDSGIQILKKNIKGFDKAYDESHKEDRWAVFFTDQESNRALEKTPYALGFTDLGMIATEHLKIKTLKLNDIMPSPETLRTGQYPLKRTLYLLYYPKSLPKEALVFLDFIRSKKGRKIMESYGYLPIT